MILFGPIAAVLMLLCTADASAAPLVIDNAERVHVPGRNISYLIDADRTLDARSIIADMRSNTPSLRWTPSQKDFPSFGWKDARIWFSFTLDVRTDKGFPWVVVLDYPLMDAVSLYRVNDDGSFTEQKSGRSLPFHAREVNYRNFVFDLHAIPSGANQYLMSFESTGSLDLSLLVMSAARVARKIANEQFLLGLYYGVLALMACYSLFLFVSLRESSYLYYVLWILGYGLYQITLNGLAFQYFWPDHPELGKRILPFFIFAGATAALQFGREFLNMKDTLPLSNRITLGIMIYNAIGMVLSFFLPYGISIRMSSLMIFIFSITLLVSGIVSFKRGFRAARFYVLAWSTLLVGVAIYALKAYGILPSNFITNWGQQIGSGLEVALLSLALADRITIMHREKAVAQRERFKAQEKFRLMVEGTQDVVFTLDDHFNFVTVNRAIREHLKISPEQAKGRNLLDFVYTPEGTADLSVKLLREKLQQYEQDRGSLTFRTLFSLPLTREPKEMQVSLEYISIDGKDEIFGKLVSVQEDALIRYFEFEKQRFAIGNHLSASEDITYRITRNLTKFMDAGDITMLRIALREIIINAIEHGNLDISYEEKTEALMNDSYFDLLAERQKHPEYGMRTVDITYAIDGDKAVYRVRDQGKGFDYRRVIDNNSEEANAAGHAHGRGVSMAKNIFDQIKYNSSGNTVLLVKRFGRTA